jgi:aminopeptidase N
MTVYNKGAELCRMLQTMLGREGFRRGLDLYFKRHDGQAVTVEDFVSAMADANGADLKDFMLWYNQAGTPHVEARFIYSATHRNARLTLSQSYPPLAGDLKRKPVPIPVKLGLVGPDGKDMPLVLEGKPVESGVIVLRKKKEVFTFEDLDERPIPSLFRDFSAPVRIDAALSDRESLALLRSDSDLFNRWQTAQAFALKHLCEMTDAVRKGESPKPNSRFIASLGEVAGDDGLDHDYRAAFLTLPSEHDIAFAIGDNVDPEAIHTARQTLRSALGRATRKILEKVYKSSAPKEPYSPDAESSGRRALRNGALALLVAGGSRFAIARVKEQAQHAANMTDTIAALSILSQSADAAYDQALQRFHRRWKNEPLVMNKWFSVQALSPAPGTLARVKELAAHPLFDLKNPNKVRALYGSFSHGNQLHFNDASGAGYDFVANAVMEIDGFNPQIASRMLGAFENWRMLEPKRRQLAEAALKRVLSKEGLSKDVFEIATKIAGEEKREAEAA